MLRASLTWAIALTLTVMSCGGTPSTTDASTSNSESPAVADSAAASTLRDRLDHIDEAVAAWRAATSIEGARVAAETAANLVVGPNGPGYGDRNGDAMTVGTASAGVLPGLDGTPPGLASPLATNACVKRDVLGGTWDNPGSQWDAMLAAIDAWRPDNNTMPTLASHPMRIVGWATLTLGSDSLDQAHEYGGHAKLHVDIALAALDC